MGNKPTIPTARVVEEPLEYETDNDMVPAWTTPALRGIFDRYEIPVGMYAYLESLYNYRTLVFVFDDSGSMLSVTNDLRYVDLHPFTKEMYPSTTPERAIAVTRFMESVNTMHVIYDVVANMVDAPPISIGFINAIAHNSRGSFFNLPRKFADESADEGHRRINEAFGSVVKFGSTPLLTAWRSTLTMYRDPTAFYFFTDGVPDGGEPTIELISRMFKYRTDPHLHPVTFFSCSDQDEDTAWLRTIDDEAKFTSEIDDYRSEAEQIRRAHGPTIPYTRGMYLLCSLLAAMWPDELDRLDERKPLPVRTIERILGRPVPPTEYNRYLRSRP